MNIRSMTATFGKLDKARLEPGPGLNVIYAPNEGGKSTWAAFWRAMLYGIDTRDRDKKGYLADKNRYQPWSGAPMAGEIQLEWKGRNITIRRGPRGNTPFGSFSAVYTGTEETVPELTAANCGEMLTGVGPAVFSRSAFVGTGNLSLTSAPELERRIAALVTSGEEEVSFSQVQSRLKDWQNKRKVNKSVGEIPRLEGELAQVREELRRLDAIMEQAARLEGEVRDLEEQRIALQQEQSLHAQLARQELNRRYTQASQELSQAQTQLDALEQESSRYGTLPDRELLKKAQGELQYLKVLDEEIKAGEDALQEAEDAYVQAQIDAQSQYFSGLTAEQARQQVDRQVHAGEQAQSRAKAWKGRGILSFGLSAALVVFYQLYLRANVEWGSNVWWFSYGLPILAVILASFGIFALARSRGGARALQAVYDRYQVHSQDELDALLQDYAARCRQAEEAAQQAKTIRGTLNDRKARRDNSWAELLEFVHRFAPEVQNLFGCSAALSRGLGLEHELTAARQRVAERRRRLDDLAAQGGEELEMASPLPTPAQSPEEVQQALAAVEVQLEQASQALNQARGRRAALGDGEQLDIQVPLSAPERTPEQTRQALEALSLRLDDAQAQLNQTQGELRSMGDPAVLSARLEALSDQLSRRNLEYDALELALNTMAEANAHLQERFSPQLNRLAGDYLAQLTGGQYQSVSLSRELEGAVRGREDLLPHSALYLSRGTADQLYLAVRLAVCRLCLPEQPPIFLDDALSAFDDARLALALKLLQQLGEEQQIFLFTCHRREQAALAQAPNVTLLTL